mmetsp:Transcript_36699/g.65636  ORF Transcript_36699/g.65636 Transcript_36699/m.65636 type:complete len:598 (-) Transcript_36699:893-2686(-)
MQGEIVSCFIGPSSAYVAAHFWNGTTQGDIKNDVLYQGTPVNRTPRLLCMDFRDARDIEYEWRLGEAPEEESEAMGLDWLAPAPMAEEYERWTDENEDECDMGEDEDEDEEVYDDQWEVQKRQKTTTDADAEAGAEDAKVDLKPKKRRKGLKPGWQYIVPGLHSSSLQLVAEGSENLPTGLGSYDMFPLGSENSTFEEDMFMDPVRRQVEACDYLGGYHITCDALGAFGGLSKRLMEGIRDDLGSRSIVLSAVHSPPQFTSTHRVQQQRVRTLNHGFSTIELSSAADVYVPINIAEWQLPREPEPFPLISFDPYKNLVATTAMIAATQDTYLLPMRQSPDVAGSYGLAELCASLGVYRSMRVSSLFSALPFPIPLGSSAITSALKATPLLSPAWTSLSHDVSQVETIQSVGQAVVVRGYGDLPINPPPNKDRFGGGDRSNPVADAQEALELYCRACPAQRCVYTAVPRAYPLSAAFPSATLSTMLDPAGRIDFRMAPSVVHHQPKTEPDDEAMDSEAEPQWSAALELPMGSHLATTPAIHSSLRKLADTFGQASIRGLEQYGRDMDEFKENCSALLALADEYADGAMYSDDDLDLSD